MNGINYDKFKSPNSLVSQLELIGVSPARNAKIIMFNFSNESMYKKKKKS